jgi:hypothetical protein
MSPGGRAGRSARPAAVPAVLPGVIRIEHFAQDLEIILNTENR